MADSKLTAAFCGWEGYTLGTIDHPGGDPNSVWIELFPDLSRALICSGCGGVADGVHDFTERWIRDLPMFDMPVHLLVQRCRVRCPKCGPKLQKLPWLRVQLQASDRDDREVAELAVKAFERSQSLKERWLTADYNAKRTILSIMLETVRLNSETLEFSLRKRFNLLRGEKLVPLIGATGNQSWR